LPSIAKGILRKITLLLRNLIQTKLYFTVILGQSKDRQEVKSNQ